MKIQEKMHIKVLNYTSSKICVETRNRGYTFEPARDGIPTFEIMSFEDIEYINSKGGIFRTGGLRFEEDEQDKIFEALKYPKWRETLITEDDIEDIIFNPTIENQERLVKIKDTGTIERIRAKLVFYNNEDTDGVSRKITNMINERFNELRMNIYNSKIVVREIKTEVSPSELDAVKKQNEDLQMQLAEMQKTMKTLLKSQDKTKPDTKKSLNNKNDDGESKKVGRPKKQDNKE